MIAVGVACVVAGLALIAAEAGVRDMGSQTALLALAVAVAACGALIMLRAVIRVSMPAEVRRAIDRGASWRPSERWDMLIAGAVLVVAALVIAEAASRTIDGGTVFALGSAFTIAITLAIANRAGGTADAARVGALAAAVVVGVAAVLLVALPSARPPVAAAGLAVVGLVITLCARRARRDAHQRLTAHAAPMAADENDALD